MLLKSGHFGERILGSLCLLFAHKTREILFLLLNHHQHQQQHDHDSMIVHRVLVLVINFVIVSEMTHYYVSRTIDDKRWNVLRKLENQQTTRFLAPQVL